MSPVSDMTFGEVALGVLEPHFPMSARFAIEWADGTGHNEPSDFLARVAHEGIAHLEPAAIVAPYRHEVITTNAKH